MRSCLDLQQPRGQTAADGRLQPPVLAGGDRNPQAGGGPARAAGDRVPAQRRLHPAGQLGAGRAGRRAQSGRGVPHVRRLQVADRVAGQVDRGDVDRSRHAAVPAQRQLRGDHRLRGRQRREPGLHLARPEDRDGQGADRSLLRRRGLRRRRLQEADPRQRRQRALAEQRCRQGTRRGVQPDGRRARVGRAVADSLRRTSSRRPRSPCTSKTCCTTGTKGASRDGIVSLRNAEPGRAPGS